MSFKIPLCVLTPEQTQHYQRLLSINGNKTNEFVKLFRMTDTHIFLPFHIGQSLYQKSCIVPNEPTTFVGNLYPNQTALSSESVQMLKTFQSVIIQAEPGFGKTILSVYLSCLLNLPTAVLIKQTIIAAQWVETFKKYTPSKKVVILTSKMLKTLNYTDADVLIINPVILKGAGNMLSHIKFLIVDELHQMMTHVLFSSFFKIQPTYLLGLSATPYRPKNDAYQITISWFFGDNIIGKELFRNYNVYYIKSKFKPKRIAYNVQGKMDWNYILNCQSSDGERNKLIVNTVLQFPERCWLILVKRVQHVTLLSDMFMEKNVKCETLSGDKKKFDKNCKILIGTTSKVGVGFDHVPIDALFIAVDILSYFKQFLGRCMRRKDVIPIVFDIQDNFSILKKHFEERVYEYKKYGGVVELYNV